MLYPTAVPLTFVDQHPAKRSPTGVADGLCQRVVLEHPTHIQVLDLDVPEFTNQPPADLVQEVGSLVGNLFVLAGQSKTSFFPSRAAFLASGQRALQPLQLLFGFTQVLGVRNFLTGVNRKTAEDMLAEMGLDMSQFPTDKHLTSWAGLSPGNNQSGGKRYSGHTRKSSRTLSAVIVQAAWSAVRTKDTFLKSRYHRLTTRRSKKRAIVAVARSILASAWHILTYRQPYRELGDDYFDQRRKDAKVSYLTRQLEKLTGGAVRIDLQAVAT
jgi:hypothetical protein